MIWDAVLPSWYILRHYFNHCSPPQDPEAKKPEDWDERATIPDPDDKKPDDWEKPEHIPDPDAAKPDDWDDEMDGEWEPPMIDNPEYKGIWAPKQVRDISDMISA